jgi:hypothetical protein
MRPASPPSGKPCVPARSRLPASQRDIRRACPAAHRNDVSSAGTGVRTLGRCSRTEERHLDLRRLPLLHSRRRETRRAYFNTNDIGGTIDDSRSTYVLGYHTTNDDWNGHFRSIKVKVRTSGAEVRHRAGYYAHPQEITTADQRQRAMLDALGSPLEANSLSFEVVADRSADQLRLRLLVDSVGLTFQEMNGRFEARSPAYIQWPWGPCTGAAGSTCIGTEPETTAQRSSTAPCAFGSNPVGHRVDVSYLAPKKDASSRFASCRSAPLRNAPLRLAWASMAPRSRVCVK